MKALYKLAIISITLLWVIYFPIAIVVMLLDLLLRINNVWVKLPYWLVGTPFLLKLQNKVVNWYIRTDWERNRDSKTLTVG